MIKNETRTRHGKCRTHGEVTGSKLVPQITFPFFITGIARGLAAIKPYRCPECGAKVA
jgi:predicted RNA-binding Zn-ribbon protein involved in translation (DUF1610 family)